MKVYTVLIIEDEADIADLVAYNFQREKFRVIKAHDGKKGIEMAQKELPDIIILDLMLPIINGVGVIKSLRKEHSTKDIPVIMLTARAQTEDRIAGLSAGADDYLTKPFSPKELLLRAQSILKRSSIRVVDNSFDAPPFSFDKSLLKLSAYGEPLDLTTTEFKLMLLLCENAGKTLSRTDVLRHVWGYSDDVVSRTLDTHVKRLRKKLGESAKYIQTIRGVGYAYVANGNE